MSSFQLAKFGFQWPGQALWLAAHLTAMSLPPAAVVEHSGALDGSPGSVAKRPRILRQSLSGPRGVACGVREDIFVWARVIRCWHDPGRTVRRSGGTTGLALLLPSTLGVLGNVQQIGLVGPFRRVWWHLPVSERTTTHVCLLLDSAAESARDDRHLYLEGPL